MAVKIREVIEEIEKIAPLKLQEDWDNSGFQLGSTDEEVSKILLVMDVTDEALDYAIQNSYNLIISHHPLFFTGLKSVDINTYKGRVIYRAITNNISIYTSHTNLDISDKGTNTALAELLELKNIKPMTNFDEPIIGVMGSFNKSFDDLINIVDKCIVSKKQIIGYGKKVSEPRKIAIVGGSGASLINTVLEHGCDTFITSDIKHHDGQLAYEKGLMVLDLTHHYSEIPVLYKLKRLLQEKLDLRIKVFDKDIFKFNILGDLCNLE